jgi:hydroxymethylpyrimidine pyrophosphatase-like HAD family hydrolase
MHKEKFEPYLRELIQKNQSASSFVGTNKIYIQTYTSHPFIDVYVTQCDKGIAFDYVTSKLSTIEGIGNASQTIMYLGDSDNDNPAFIKADIPICIRSDDRLKPKLSCSRFVKFDELSTFLKNLMANNFLFSENFVHSI